LQSLTLEVRMHRRLAAVLVCSALTLAGCGRHTPVAPTTTPEDVVPPVDLSVLTNLERTLRPPASRGAASGNSPIVVLPAGSVDALAGAIAQAGPHGFVILSSGLHRESGMVEVTIPVVIMGDPGAVLESTVPTWPAGNPVLQAAIWVHNAEGVAIRDLEMRPAGGLGGAAILLDGARSAAVLQNNIHDYQYGVLVYDSDHASIWSNRVSTTTAWQTAVVPEAHGIVVISGASAMVAQNKVSNALFGIWACDRDGIAYGNTVSANLVGLILCRVPAGSYPLPGGEIVGASASAVRWLAQGNVCFGNFTTGLLAIDGSSANRILSNDSHDNGGYAIELAGDSYRFGFLTPASFDNLFVAGAYANVQVKNCGNGNRVIGGKLVDNTAEPCN
jgi:hypothetical protein